VGGVLRLPAQQLHVRRQLGQMGLDSLMALELRSRFERALGRPLSATLAFNHPTVEALTTYFDALLAPEPTSGPDAATDASETDADTDAADGLLVSLAELSDLSDADVADALRGARQAS
jgi:aryl carrier-like protein